MPRNMPGNQVILRKHDMFAKLEYAKRNQGKCFSNF